MERDLSTCYQPETQREQDPLPQLAAFGRLPGSIQIQQPTQTELCCAKHYCVQVILILAQRSHLMLLYFIKHSAVDCGLHQLLLNSIAYQVFNFLPNVYAQHIL